MKQVNFNNHEEDDDQKMIQLLRSELKDVPSDQLIENTMEKFLNSKRVPRIVFQPLRLPLYIMAVIAILLVLPSIVPLTLDNNGGLLPGVGDMIFGIVEYLSLSWVAVTVLVIGRLLITTASEIKFKHLQS